MSQPSQNGGPVKAVGKGRLAWFPLYAIDWLDSAQIREMPPQAEALYMRMLCRSWLEGPLPTDPRVLARRLGGGNYTTRFVTRWLPFVLTAWTVAGTCATNARLEVEREKAIRERKNRVLGAEMANAQRDAQRDAQRADRACDGDCGSSGSGLVLSVPKKARAPRTDDQGRVLQHFEHAYQEAYGERYTFRRGRDGKALKQIVEELGRGDVAACCERIDRAFADDWWRSKVVSLKTLADHWERFPVGRPSDSSRKSNQLRFIEEVRDTL